jgi:transcriptional regulator with XRE-family HTH domain
MADERADRALGEFIRAQRELAEIPMRQLASAVGISGPYLSQIERGLRAPSDAVLESLARSLQTSADTIREQVRSATEDEEEPEVVAAIRRDPDLTASQRRAMVEMYEAFVETTVGRRRRPGRSKA